MGWNTAVDFNAGSLPENPKVIEQIQMNLKGRLLIYQNFEDDNVLFQNTLQMTSALLRAGKQFEFMLYPQKTHTVTAMPSTPSSTIRIRAGPPSVSTIWIYPWKSRYSRLAVGSC